jgi:hypothetical protein
MNTENPDLFGKIDAMLGRRAPDALLDKGLDIEDFPLLTDVVDASREAWTEAERRDQDRRQNERRQLDRRLGDRRQDGRRATDRRQVDPPVALPADMDDGMEGLVAAMEQRLTDMFIRQQLRMEDAVRKAIRDELGRHREDQT